jgi:hypothetical protein
MGMLWRKCASNHTAGVLLEISFVIIVLIGHFVYVNTTPGPLTSMGITMRASTSKEKPTKRAIITTAATTKEHRSKWLAKSPRTINVNSLLAEINLPTNRFDNVLEALHPSTRTSPTDDSLKSPTGVDTLAIGINTLVDNKPPQANKSPQNQTTPPSRSMQINKTATLVESTANMSGGTSQG